MKSLNLVVVLALVTLGSSSLLEMSQVLWSRLLSGGYRKIGGIDPLRVPVVKVDQSEGNTSYRVILRDLEIHGLNSSTIESVHMARGSLKSNLSENEAGYVSYNEQDNLDSIRYRFHTLVKESKSKSEKEERDHFEKVVEYDPKNTRVREEDDLLQSYKHGSQTQRYYANPVQLQHQNRTFQPIYGDMRVAMNATRRNPSSLHLVLSNSYKNAEPNPQTRDEDYRPCVGACKRYPDSSSRIESGGYSSQQAQLSHNENARSQTRIYPDQRYNADRVSAESTTAAYAIKAQLGGPGFSAETSNGQRPNQFAFKRGNFGISYTDDSQNTRVPLDGQRNDHVTPVYRVGYESTERGQRPVYFRGYVNPSGDDKYSKQEHDQSRYQEAHKSRYTESITSTRTNNFESRESPFIRLEKQPGYVDIVYASPKSPESQPKSEKLIAAPEDDPRAYGFAEIVKDLRENQRYIIHNFTEGESLRKRNDAVRAAAESKRIKDLIRYAKEYQEKQGYFEEGVELIYHFGNLKNSSSSNDTLTRRKRQHYEDKDEDDVMHVVVRIRVPKLSVKSHYALTGKVGKQLLRGNGLLVGNFTDLVADFTVELKKVNNETMIVRAARAKLISEHREIKLEGMDEKGPVDAILVQGLMAAEAVAAMIADDLASKALNEGNAETVIYKMYKNLPVVERV